FGRRRHDRPVPPAVRQARADRPLGAPRRVPLVPRARRSAGLRLRLLRSARPLLVPGRRATTCSRVGPRRGSVLTMAGLLQRIRGWWNKDAPAVADEETRMTQAERDAASEDFEARKDDLRARDEFLAGGAADYERDSEPPADPAP